MEGFNRLSMMRRSWDSLLDSPPKEVLHAPKNYRRVIYRINLGPDEREGEL